MSWSETLHYYWTEMADPRTNGWPLMGSPYAVPLLIFAYLYFVLRCGPRYMKNREPYSLKEFIKFYNIFQIVVNAWIVYSFIDAGWFTKMSIYCQPVDYSYSYGPYKLVKTMWWTLLLKLIDFIETGVFLLRKKDNQVSFLHLYHHCSTVLIQWLGTKYVGGGMSTFIVLVNCSVHVIMYSYYYMSTLGPQVRKIIAPFKHVITIMQMVQFIGLMVYILQTLLPSCDVPKYPGPIFIVNLMINFFLFYDFYKKSYESPKEKEN